MLLSIGYIQFIRKPKRRINVQQSSTAIITCIVKGTPAVEITWLKNGRKMSRDHHYSISHKYSNYALTSILQIYSIMATDKGRYTCLASNSIVSSKKHTYIKVKRLGTLLLYSTMHTRYKSYNNTENYIRVVLMYIKFYVQN